MALRERVYNLHLEPCGYVYRQLLAFLSSRAQSAILVVREESRLEESGRAVLNDLRPQLIREEARGAWPGTQLLRHTATVYTYSVSQSAIDTLSKAVEGLYSWVEPAYPQDLCFLRTSGTPTLTTIAHQRLAYLQLTDDEFKVMCAKVPGIRTGLGSNT